MTQTGPRLGDNPTVYQVYVCSFQDSNGDGVGDINGVAQRLDELQRLGADAIWLSPIFDSPLRDGGYDVADYQSINPVFGNLQDVDNLIAAAHSKQIAVLFDMVPRHTSIDHAWFKEHHDLPTLQKYTAAVGHGFCFSLTNIPPTAEAILATDQSSSHDSIAPRGGVIGLA